MASKQYTIKQLSDELGVTKPGLRKQMNDSFRKRYTTVTGNRILISEAGAKVLREHFENSKEETKEKPETETKNSNQKQAKTVSDESSNAVLTAKDETITLLKEQLKAKDDQIANMQKLMDQNQQLLLNTQSENKHLLALTHDTRKMILFRMVNIRNQSQKISKRNRKPITRINPMITAIASHGGNEFFKKLL